MAKKKHIMSFKEFLEYRKKTQSEHSKEHEFDWQTRKDQWLKAVDILYKLVDDLIVSSYIDAGYEVSKERIRTTIHEDFIGSYPLDNYIIYADGSKIIFNPVGTIIIGSQGRVNMVLPKETIILIIPSLENPQIWKIVKGIGHERKLLDFNEKNLVAIFANNL